MKIAWTGSQSNNHKIKIFDKLDFVKIQKYSSIDAIKNPNMQTTKWENIFTKYISEKKLLSRLYKDILQLSNKRKNKPLPLNGQKTGTNISPKKIYKWWISTWKCAPHNLSSWIYKFKSQWHATKHPLKWPEFKRSLIPCFWGRGVTRPLTHCWWE